jgi:hypothetical protein
MTALVAAAVFLHWGVAARKSAGLLEHDEAISLLAAAGKSQRVDELYDDMRLGPVVQPAGDLQDLLRPTGDVRAINVVRSLSQRDIHPPLYFLILHELGRLGAESWTLPRMFGTLMFLIAAWAAGRWIWPQAWGPARWLGTAWLLLTPAMMNIATELRQYALVYLGVVLSISALILLWEERRPVRHTLMLLALFPVILLWSQFGTIVWVALGLTAVAVHAAADLRRRWKLAAGSVAAALILLTPLLLWTCRIYAVRGRPEPVPLDDAYAGAVLPLSAGLAESWCCLPWEWRETIASPVVVAAALAFAAVLLWRRGRSADWMLWGAAVIWGVLWMVLLALGRVPPHAVEPKQLAPLTLVPVCVMVRAASRTQATWVRRALVGLLAVSVGGLSVRTWQMLGAPRDEALLTALREANCLIVDAPKRGYVLPLADKMKPDARVIVVSAESAIEQWPRLTALLPEDRLLLAEMGTYDDRRPPGAEQLSERLVQRYREVRVLRKGPKRTVTEFRGLHDG